MSTPCARTLAVRIRSSRFRGANAHMLLAWSACMALSVVACGAAGADAPSGSVDAPDRAEGDDAALGEELAAPEAMPEGITARVRGAVALAARERHGGVVLAVDGTPWATSEPSGVYVLDDVEPGTRNVSASAPGYLCNEVEVTVEAGNTALARGMYLSGGDPVADDTVNLFDLVLVAASYRRDPPLDGRADINASGSVDLFDLVLVSGNYGHECPFDLEELAPPVPPEPTESGPGTVVPSVTPTAADTATAPPTRTVEATAAPSPTVFPSSTADPTAEAPSPTSPATVAPVATARPDGGPVRPAAEALIVVSDGRFVPHALYVAPGARVVWRNDDAAPHDVRAVGGEFETRLAPGETLEWEASSGVFPYGAHLGSAGEGVIIVVADVEAAERYFGGGAVRDYYVRWCGHCHGADRQGAGGPPLLPAALSKSDTDYVSIVRDGVEGTGMPAFGAGLAADELWGLVGYLRSEP